MIKSDNISDYKKHTTDPIYKSDNRNTTTNSDARLENRKLRLAILGAGGIARKMAETVNQMEDVELYAVASRTEEKARQFADTYHASKWYGSYEEMVADDGIDLVYVATPHSHHKEHTMLCLNYNRAVLCEKAFAVNTKEAEDMIRLAKEKNILLAEAMWVRYMPMSFTLKEIIDSDVIGKITGLTANLGYSLMQVERLIRPELAGGALLDLAPYTLNFATWVLGDNVSTIHTTMTPHETGVDKTEFINLVYPDGAIAGLFTTMESATDRRGVIYGTKGYIEVDNINNYEAFRIYENDRRLVQTINCPAQISGYEYEVLACKRALEKGLTECPEMPHEHTLYIMRLFDEIRKSW